MVSAGSFERFHEPGYFTGGGRIPLLPEKM
jgi:hypothetical protein